MTDKYFVDEKSCIVGDRIHFISNNRSQESSWGVIAKYSCDEDSLPHFEIETEMGLLKISEKNLHRNPVLRKEWYSEEKRALLVEKKKAQLAGVYSNNEEFCRLMRFWGYANDDILKAYTSVGLDITKSKISGWRRSITDRRFHIMSNDDLKSCIYAVTKYQTTIGR